MCKGNRKKEIHQLSLLPTKCEADAIYGFEDCEVKCSYKRQSQMTLPFDLVEPQVYQLSFLLIPATPIRPMPRRNMVAGSRTANSAEDRIPDLSKSII